MPPSAIAAGAPGAPPSSTAELFFARPILGPQTDTNDDRLEKSNDSGTDQLWPSVQRGFATLPPLMHMHASQVAGHDRAGFLHFCWPCRCTC